MLPDLTLSRRNLLGSLLILPLSSYAENDWIPLFDGRSLDGWKASESNTSFRVVDGLIAADGPRSHLFYTGGVHNASFKNFELKVDVLTKRGCNSGVYFHTEFQPAGFPAKGFEVQVNNTYVGEGGYRERKKTGSLYAIRDVYKPFVKDDEWFQMRVLVRGKQAQIFLNDVLLVDYVEPEPPLAGRRLDRGTFALQCHNPGSRALFRNILVRPLPDDAAPTNLDRPLADDVYREIVRMNAENYPVVDYHAHLNGGLTVEDILREGRRNGIQYGIAVNCGQSFPIHDDAGVGAFLDRMKGQPVFVALQGEGREWVNLVSKETLARFDYVFTDAMTFTDDKGKRMRLWIKGEVGQIDDPQGFMDVLVNRLLTILGTEPIDIYVNPTFVPDVIAHMYDELWTPERMQKVIEAAKKREIAIEINNRYKIPKAPFIRLAKQAGVKFSFGTNNDTRELGRLEYAIQMVKECGLGWQDIFVPRSAT